MQGRLPDNRERAVKPSATHRLFGPLKSGGTRNLSPRHHSGPERVESGSPQMLATVLPQVVETVSQRLSEELFVRKTRSFTFWKAVLLYDGSERCSDVESAPLSLKATAEVTERRAASRQAIVLRVGIIDDGLRPSFCLVRNISSAGAQVKLFGHLARGSQVSLRLGDEDPLPGRVMWIRDDVAGIRFDELLEPKRLLRVTQKFEHTRRRSSPRVRASARAILNTDGRTYVAEVCDISASGVKVRT